MNNAGVYLTGTSAVVEGNYIGTDATGTVAFGNGTASGSAARSTAIIGGLTGTPGTGAGNLISGNDTTASTCRRQHDGRGQPDRHRRRRAPRPWATARPASTSSHNVDGTVIGGTDAAARNVISGNDGNGIELVYVAGQYVRTGQRRSRATTSARTSAARPPWATPVTASCLDGATHITIGGTPAAARNVISGNGTAGVVHHRHPATRATSSPATTSAPT